MEKKETGFGRKGWLLIFYCMAAYYVSTAFKDTMNVAVYTFEEKYGWSQVFLLSLASIGQYAACIAVYIGGILNASQKIKVRTISFVMGTIYSVTIGLWGIIPSLTLFAINYIIMMIGVILWTQFANNTICANWFPKKSGAVMGWATIGFPLAAATNAIIFSQLTSVMSFQAVYILFGVISLAVTLWGFISFRDYPEEMGCYPDNDTSMTKEDIENFAKAQAESNEKSIWSGKKMLKTKEAWAIGISAGALCLVSSGSMTQMIVRFINGGMEMDLAIQMMAIVGFSAMFGSWLIGKLDYKFGTKPVFIVTLLVVAAACVTYSVNSVPAMVAGGIFIGIGLGGGTNFNVSLVTHYWGRQNFQKAYGTILTIINTIGASGAAVVAVLAGRFSYTVAYIVMAVVLIVSALLMLPVKDGFVERYEKEYR